MIEKTHTTATVCTGPTNGEQSS